MDITIQFDGNNNSTWMFISQTRYLIEFVKE